MSKKVKTIFDIPFVLNGIPCIIGVISADITPKGKGSPWNYGSDIDYYGQNDVNYAILDRKGYDAPWLQNKINKKIQNEIDNKINHFFNL